MFRFFRRATKEDTQPEYIEDYRSRAEVIAITKRLGSMTTDLSPCPFCGGNPSEITDLLNSEYSKFYAHIECEQCGCRTKQVEITSSNDPLEELRQIWETRVTPNAILDTEIAPAQDDGKCSHCYMPKSYMPECAATRMCYRLQDEIQHQNQDNR